jgi:hypothetical protein
LTGKVAVRKFTLPICGIVFPVTAAISDTYIVYFDGTGDSPTILAVLDEVGDGDNAELTDGTERRQAATEGQRGTFCRRRIG